MEQLQEGGTLAKGFLEFVEKTKGYQTGLLYIFYTLLIVFKEQVPASVHRQADSLVGRLFIVLSVYGITTYYSWILGIIAAIAYGLLLGLPSVNEGFGSGGETSLEFVPSTKKWFVERVMKENPIAIEEEKVVTSAVQDDTRSGVSGGVQNTSVQ